MPTIPPFRATRLARLLPALLAALLAGPAGGAGPAPPADGWIAFEANLSAAGHRRAVRAGEREAATFHLSGSLVVVRGEGLRKGFRAEAIGYDDGTGGGAGAFVLTDDRGDQIFAELSGGTSARGKTITGKITGGTGAWTGIAGDFSFDWRHLVLDGDGAVQGVAERFHGRYRRESVPPAEPKR